MLKNKILLFPALWIMMWILPWGKLVSSIVPALALALTLILFIIPGYCASQAILADRVRRPMHALIGFALSNLLVALLGIAARLIHLPFTFIQYTFGVFGVIAIYVWTQKIKIFRRPVLDPWIVLIALCIAVAFAAFVSIFAYAGDNFIVSDDASYLAYVTNWQNSTSLNYSEVIYGTDNTDSIRFWLSYFPMTMAVLSSVSHVPGILLISLYFDPLLIIFAILAAYEIGIAFGLSPRHSATSLIAMLVFYFLMAELTQPGAAFFKRMGEDKVFATFILAPAFVQSMLLFQRHPDRPNALMTLLTGLSLTFTHPVSLFYTVIVGGLYTLMSAWIDKAWKTFAISIVIMAIMILPLGVLRFVDHPSKIYAFDAQSALEVKSSGGLVRAVDNSIFYGFNPEKLYLQFPVQTHVAAVDWFLKWGFAWIMIAGIIWSLFNIRNSELARYLLAGAILVAAAGFPYTGWIIGWMVSARMLVRSFWFFPIGLALIALIAQAGEVFLKWIKLPADSINPRLDHILLIGSLIIAPALIIPSAFQGKQWLSPSELARKEAMTSDLAKVGDFFESLSEPVIVIGAGPLNPSVPGLSSKSKALIFRTDGPISFGYFINAQERADREQTMNLIFASATPMDETRALLDKYDIAYLLISSGPKQERPFTNNSNFKIFPFGSVSLIQYAP